jgi:hypothetical protein
MSAGPDQYTETAILYAVMNDDPDRARSLIADMTETELAAFYGQLSEVIDLANDQLRAMYRSSRRSGS